MECKNFADIIGQFWDAIQWDLQVLRYLYPADRSPWWETIADARSELGNMVRAKEIQSYLDRQVQNEELATIQQQLIALNSPTKTLSNIESQQLELAAQALALQQREIEIKQLQATNRQEIIRLYRDLLSEIQAREIDTQLTKIQTDWDRDTWFSKLSRQETELILNRHRHRLLILVAPPKIARSKSLNLFHHLDFELEMRSVGDFLGKHYPPQHPEHPVKFYSSYFREPISDLDVERLQPILAPIASYIIYCDIKPETFVVRVAHWGIQAPEVNFLPPLTWNWHATKQSLLDRGDNAATADRAILHTAIKIYQFLTAYLADLYYLHLTPNYQPQLLANLQILNLPILHPALETIDQFQHQQRDIYQQKIAEIVATEFPPVKPLNLSQSSGEIENLRQQLAIEIERREAAENLCQQLQSAERINANLEDTQGKLFEFFVPSSNHRGNIIAETIHQARCLTIELGNGIDLEMVYIPGGSYMMGSQELDAEKPLHQVTVSPFHLGKYPITQAQYEAMMGENPSHFMGDQRPVEQVSWWDALRFCRKLSTFTQQTYRLPTEAEWEYAARAGTSTAFHFGDGITPHLANYHRNISYGIASTAKSREETSNVGSYPPNAFGLYDMHGNVSEWCQDTWHDNYAGAPTDGRAWVTTRSGKEPDAHILRGGSWYYSERGCRSATRDYYAPDYSSMSIGFRIVLLLT
jgi:formylglycine-generating enzyme required for sulfatase activity